MIRVVVVDDEALVRSGFELILNASDGIRVVATAEGVQAVDVIRREHPDVVLLDIRMPDVDGLTVLREIQTLPEPPTALFVANHESSVGVLRVIAERGISVPQDLSLLFYEDSPWFEWQRPAISVVDSGATEMANLAVDRLMQRLGGVANSGREYRVGSRLIERASCLNLSNP